MTDLPDNRASLARQMIARLEADHAAIVGHATMLAAALDFLATVIVVEEPNAGSAEVMISSLVGALVLGSGVASWASGLAATLTLMTEKGIDAGLLAWAKARLNARKE